jgi:hypothetical protein
MKERQRAIHAFLGCGSCGLIYCARKLYTLYFTVRSVLRLGIAETKESEK